MSDLINTLLNTFSGDGLALLGNKAGVDKKTAGKALTAILPSLIHALNKNSSSPEGAKSLNNALEKDHDGTILDNIFDSLKQQDESAGQGILGHIFGKKQPAVENGIGKTLGINASAIGKIMSLVAPFLMGIIGKTRQENQLGAADINHLLMNEEASIKRRSRKKLSPILSFIDQDSDGEITDDLLNIGFGFLGRLFRRRT
jgi:hypothetical protein